MGEVRGNVVRVNGTKTEHAERVIPLLYPVVKPSLTYRQFNRRLEKLNMPVQCPRRPQVLRPLDERGRYPTHAAACLLGACGT